MDELPRRVAKLAEVTFKVKIIDPTPAFDEGAIVVFDPRLGDPEATEAFYVRHRDGDELTLRPIGSVPGGYDLIAVGFAGGHDGHPLDNRAAQNPSEAA